MKIADAHTHIFPSKISLKASKSIGDFYDTEMAYPADVEILLENEKQIGAKYALVCSSAVTPSQVTSINDFISASCKAVNQRDEGIKFVGFAAMHADFENMHEELDRAKELGLVGVKFHNDFQKVDIDDPRALPIYREMAKRNMTVLFHAGDNRYDYSAPERIANVIREVPELRVILSHFGGYRRWSELSCMPSEGNYCFDTSSSLMFISTDEAMRILERFGAERFMFGTDFPMWDAKDELARFMKLPLTDREREDILYNNFAKLFL